jgi:hypothetical protein
MKMLIALVGALAIMLGGLWLLQGLGAVRLRPILCFADCAPVQGPSTTWALIGAAAVVAGAWVLFRALRRR